MAKSPLALGNFPPMPGGKVFFLIVALLASLFGIGHISGPLASAGARENSSSKTAHSARRLSSDSSGTIRTHDGQTLHLTTDLGNVIVQTHNSAAVDYRLHLETDASQPNSEALLKTFSIHASAAPGGVSLTGRTGHQSSGRLWVTLEVSIPRQYSLDVSTGGGNIETGDVNGHADLSTAGGDISVGNIGGSARLDTNGGHITVKDVQADLLASTGGGHITAGVIGRNATLHTSGGHIRVSSIAGAAHLATGGGNVTLEHSGGGLVAETSGGQIEIGEAAGLVRAKTGGGGIRLARISGPSELKTVGGSIYLTQVNSAVKASTAAGGITAWFVAPPSRPGPCEFDSSEGDIVVHLPRQLPVTIDAQVEMADEHRMIVDPAFPLKLSYGDSINGLRMIRAEGALNGGGEILRLRAMEGNIRFVLSDANKQMQLYNQEMEQLEQQLRLLRLQLRNLLPSQEIATAQR